MNQNNHLKYLRHTAQWCLTQYEGILTPTGKPKKPPTFHILKCGDCGELTLTSTKTVKAKRFLCSVQNVSPDKTGSTSRPRTKVCEGTTTIIEEVMT